MTTRWRHDRLTLLVACVVALVLVLFALNVGSGGNGVQSTAVTLPLYEKEYIEVLTGNPGRYIRYRIDFRLNDSYLYTEPRDYSRTYSVWFDESAGKRRGSDVLYFGEKRVRVPLVYTQPVEDYVSSLYHSVHHQGVLGLGPGSTLRRYWTTMTVSASSVTFGAFDRRDVMYNAPLLAIVDGQDGQDGGSVRARVADQAYRVRFDPASEYTLLPPDVYEYARFQATLERPSHEHCMALCAGMHGVDARQVCASTPQRRTGKVGDEMQLVVSMDDMATFTSAGHHLYHMVDVNRASPDTIVLGRAYMEQLVMYVDAVAGVRLFYDSYRHFHMSGFDDFNKILSWIIVMAYVTWATCVHGKTTPSSERVRVFFFVVQVYSLILVAAAGLYNLVGLNYIRLFVRHMHAFQPGAGDAWFVGFVLVYGALWAWNIALVVSTTHYGRFYYGFLPKSGWNRHGDITLVRRATFEMSMLLALWLSMFYLADEYYGFLFLLPIAAWLALCQLTMLLQSLSRSGEDRQWLLVHAVLAALGAVFFLCFNLLPYMENYYSQHPCKEALVLFVSLLLFAVSLVLYVWLEKVPLDVHTLTVAHYCQSRISNK